MAISKIDDLKYLINKSNCFIYCWNFEEDEIEWFGDIKKIFPDIDSDLEVPKNKNDFIARIAKEDKEKFKTSLEISLENIGTSYNRSYSVQLKTGKTLDIKDEGEVLEDDNGKKVLFGRIELANRFFSLTKTNFNPDNEYFNFSFFYKLQKTFDKSISDKTENVVLKILISNLASIVNWYSKEFANEIMKSLEEKFREILGGKVVIERIALDQFGIIVKDTKFKQVKKKVDKIIAAANNYYHPHLENYLYISISVGSVVFPSNYLTLEEVLNNLYLSLQKASEKSLSNHCDYSVAQGILSKEKEDVENVQFLEKAFLQNKIKLAYQPLVSSKTGKTSRHEALLRVEEDGIIKSAGPLIPVAEKLGKINKIDIMVLELIIEELKKDDSTPISFNISNMTTDDCIWLKKFQKLVVGNQKIAEKICVEITETAAQRDLRQTAYFVATMQSFGCKVALDDFGSGYTSFHQLKHLSVDMVKIDGIFIRNLEKNSENYLFIKTLLDFNKSYGLTTTAEFVESGEIAKLLIDLGVDYLQGYYLGKPLLTRSVEKLSKVSDPILMNS